MKHLLLLGLALLLGSCTSFEHTAQAPRSPRHQYQHQQRRHQAERGRFKSTYLPWN